MLASESIGLMHLMCWFRWRVALATSFFAADGKYLTHGATSGKFGFQMPSDPSLNTRLLEICELEIIAKTIDHARMP